MQSSIKSISFRHPAVGVVETNADHPKISIKFDRPMFERINRLACSNRVSFAEAVRQLVASGIGEKT